MSLGLPAIATRVGHIPEVIQDGVNGYTYEPKELERLACLASVLSAMSPEKRSALGRAARETMVTKHDINYCAAQYEETFRGLLPRL